VLIYTKTKSKTNELSTLFSQNKIKKYYLANVKGTLKEDRVEVSDIERERHSLTTFHKLYYNKEKNSTLILCCPQQGNPNNNKRKEAPNHQSFEEAGFGIEELRVF
jgi:23S rRNA-/tRNA-specific pseudouridylate synthase